VSFKLPDNAPFVGHSAFAHKGGGGLHIDACSKNPLAYEHINLDVIGNHRRFINVRISRKMPIIIKAQKLICTSDKKITTNETCYNNYKKKTTCYQFEATDASFELFFAAFT